MKLWSKSESHLRRERDKKKQNEGMKEVRREIRKKGRNKN